MVNTSLPTADLTNLFPLFRAAAQNATESDAAGREIEREIAYATLDAIGEAAVDVCPDDIPNALHRLGVALYFIERIRDGLFDHDGGDAELAKIKKLISGAARVIVQHEGVDVKETSLNFYLLGMEART
jgi:hypothetical protein